MATGGESSTAEIQSGYLIKLGSKYRKWKKRYFVLKDTNMIYFEKMGDTVEKPKRIINLTKGRGIRERKQCPLAWPKDAEDGLCFGLATEKRTYYFYGADKKEIEEWMSKIQKIIQEVGKPTDDWVNDINSVPAAALSKAMKGAKVVMKVAKIAKSTGLLPSSLDPVEGILETATDAVEVVGDLAENKIVTGVVSTAAGVVKDQIEADGDLSLKQRLALAGGSALEGVSGMIDMDIAAGALEMAGNVVKDAAQAKEPKQRLVPTEGSALGESDGSPLGEASRMVNNGIGDGALKVAASTTDEVSDSDQTVGDSTAEDAAKGVGGDDECQ